MTSLPKDYVVKKFYEFGYKVKHLRGNDSYCCCCPICMEGKSYGKKQRCWYLPSKDLIYCHNCGWSSRPLRWIMTVGNLTRDEVNRELLEGDYMVLDLDKSFEFNFKELIPNTLDDALPVDSIDLFNKLQLDYYKTNPVIIKAVEYIKERKLDVAINKPNTFFISLTDEIHKNRLVIPYYDINNEIVWYQTRAIDSIITTKDSPRYLSKKNCTRSVFNINKVDNNFGYLFLTEGPIDACFIKNGLGIGGINQSADSCLTEYQENQLEPFLHTHERIWVLDSQWIDEAAFLKSAVLLKRNENVFLWPEEMGKNYKDFNEFCVKNNVNEIPSDLVIKNKLCGEIGLLKYNMILKNR